ncbi:MAG: hypothetical protein K2H23_04830, partial [Oscillospiraceae bacterium]|nr:hypothetical protein [Oscillospiraceae bacterium]
RRNAEMSQNRSAADSGTRFEPVSSPQENSGQAGNSTHIGNNGNGSYNSHSNRQNGSPVRSGVRYQNFPNGRSDAQNGNSRNMQTANNNTQNHNGQRNSRQPQNMPVMPPPPPPVHEPEYDPPREQTQTNSSQPQQSQQENGSLPVPDIFSGLNTDSEQLLLLALIYLLIREKADFKLILALCYLIL